MEYRTLAKSDLKVSVVGLGTWQFGTEAWGFGADFTEQDARAVLERALELGINHIDTAEVYGKGRSEEIIGEVLADRRDEVVITTKVSGDHLRYKDVKRAAERSLRRLRTKYIDLYLVHWPNYYIPLRETMRALEDLVADGKVRYVGVSNFSVCMMEEARSYLNRIDLVANQVRYNLLQREVEAEILPYLKREGLTLIAYSPLAKGLLTGKYTVDNLPADAVRSGDPLFSKEENLRAALRVVDVLRSIGKRYGKTPAQVAINWLLRDPSVVAIVGAKRPEQVIQNAGAADFKLTEDESHRIEEVTASLCLDYS